MMIMVMSRWVRVGRLQWMGSPRDSAREADCCREEGMSSDETMAMGRWIRVTASMGQ